MLPINSPIVIFSVFQSVRSDSYNLQSHKSLLNFLEQKGIGFKVLKGFYKGESELSVLVHANHLKTIEKIAIDFFQESILISDSNRLTSLHFLKDGTTENIGTLKKVSQKQALASDCYTFDVSTGHYWLCI